MTPLSALHDSNKLVLEAETKRLSVLLSIEAELVKLLAAVRNDIGRARTDAAHASLVVETGRQEVEKSPECRRKAVAEAIQKAAPGVALNELCRFASEVGARLGHVYGHDCFCGEIENPTEDFRFEILDQVLEGLKLSPPKSDPYVMEKLARSVPLREQNQPARSMPRPHLPPDAQGSALPERSKHEGSLP